MGSSTGRQRRRGSAFRCWNVEFRIDYGPDKRQFDASRSNDGAALCGPSGFGAIRKLRWTLLQSNIESSTALSAAGGGRVVRTRRIVYYVECADPTTVCEHWPYSKHKLWLDMARVRLLRLVNRPVNIFPGDPTGGSGSWCVRFNNYGNYRRSRRRMQTVISLLDWDPLEPAPIRLFFLIVAIFFLYVVRDVRGFFERLTANRSPIDASPQLEHFVRLSGWLAICSILLSICWHYVRSMIS